MESEFILGFKKRFMEDTMPEIARDHLESMANAEAIRHSSDPQMEYDKLEAEYIRAGAYPFTFDSGTSPAVKQLRHKLLLASCGAINLQIDEIGSNLIGATDVLNTFLELYDQGLIKQKLVKNTVDNVRGKDLEGKTPTNMLLFGTPVKLLDGGLTEDQFYSFLETGYARRCIFGLGQCNRKAYYSLTPTEIFSRLTDPSNNHIINKWSSIFTDLADKIMYKFEIQVPDDVAITLLEYKVDCEKKADNLPEYEEIKKAELSHRYFKALKLAGAFAFVDRNSMLTKDELLQAILLVEESGEAFQKLLHREKAHVKLAKYIATIGTEVTHADLTDALPFYKGGSSARNEMMNLAIAWGYKNNIIIKKSYADGVELFTGETLKETDLNKIILSYSTDLAYNYASEDSVPFDKLDILCLASDPKLHWCNHKFIDGHRAETNAIPGFNMIVLDIDGTIKLDTALELLKDYKFIAYTTKRHTEEENRFRVILPINYELELDSEDYKEFMNNVMKWLPFKVDESCNQRSKKWESNNGQFFSNDGKLLDALMFIPRTSRNEQFNQNFQKIESMDNLERWFAQRISEGNRNNNMIKYALALVDSGLALNEVEKQIISFNKKLSNPLPETEIRQTILKTVAKKYE